MYVCVCMYVCYVCMYNVFMYMTYACTGMYAIKYHVCMYVAIYVIIYYVCMYVCMYVLGIESHYHCTVLSGLPCHEMTSAVNVALNTKKNVCIHVYSNVHITPIISVILS